MTPCAAQSWSDLRKDGATRVVAAAHSSALPPGLRFLRQGDFRHLSFTLLNTGPAVPPAAQRSARVVDPQTHTLLEACQAVLQ